MVVMYQTNYIVVKYYFELLINELIKHAFYKIIYVINYKWFGQLELVLLINIWTYLLCSLESILNHVNKLTIATIQIS